MDKAPETAEVPIRLTILSGNLRGRIVNIEQDCFRIGSAEGCDLRLEGEPDVQGDHAEIVREDCDVYLRKTSPNAVLIVNRQEVAEIILQDGDLMALGASGPRIRARLPEEQHRKCKPIFEICRDCIDVVKFANEPPRKRAQILLRQMSHDLIHQSTRLFRFSVLCALIILAGTAGTYAWWNARQLRNYEAALRRLGEESEKERLNLTNRLRQLQEAAGQSAEEAHQRAAGLQGSLAASGTEIQRLQKDIQALREEFDFAPSVVARYSGGVCFIVGGYGFVEKVSGKSLRFAGLDSQGEPLRDSSGRAQVVVGDQGMPVARFYTGSGFLVSHEGHILTNRHVAEPWVVEETDQQILRQGFEPVHLALLAYFPGDRSGYPLTLLKSSSTADLALLRTQFGKSRPPVLMLSREKPRPGEPILLLGYPAGYDALLARYEKQTIDSIVAEKPSNPAELSEALARHNLIRPIATQGHLGDVLKDRLVYDAQTTHGGSGGPVLNARGEVIGINFAVLQDFGGSNFGVPAELAQSLISHEK